MKNKIIILLLASLFFVSYAYAQEDAAQKDRSLSIGLSGGISKILGENGEDYKLGYIISAHGFHHFSNRILVGARFAYNGWQEKGGEVEGAVWSGSRSIVEFTPAIRILSPINKSRSVKLMGHAGLGLFLLHWKKEIEAKDVSSDSFFYNPYSGNYYNPNYDYGTYEETDEAFGFNIGGGMIVGKKRGVQFELLLLYNIVFPKDKSFSYLTLNLGIGFGR